MLNQSLSQMKDMNMARLVIGQHHLILRRDSNEWIIEDEYWQPADDRPHIDIISIKGRLSMAPGDTYQYNVSFTPANPVEGKEVTWESSDPDVVSIDEMLCDSLENWNCYYYSNIFKTHCNLFYPGYRSRCWTCKVRNTIDWRSE